MNGRDPEFYSSYKNDGICFSTFKFMYNKYKGYDIEGDSSKSGGSKYVLFSVQTQVIMRRDNNY